MGWVGWLGGCGAAACRNAACVSASVAQRGEPAALPACCSIPSIGEPAPAPCRYDEIEGKLTPFLRGCGYNPKKDLLFIPISGARRWCSVWAARFGGAELAASAQLPLRPCVMWRNIKSCGKHRPWELLAE